MLLQHHSDDRRAAGEPSTPHLRRSSKPLSPSMTTIVIRRIIV
jgi:hypothetical protein